MELLSEQMCESGALGVVGETSRISKAMTTPAFVCVINRACSYSVLFSSALYK